MEDKMYTIYKYYIGDSEISSVAMPKGSTIISAGLDGNNELCVWAQVPYDGLKTSEYYELRYFATIGTGWVFGSGARDYKFIATVNDGPYMWHIFEIIEPIMAAETEYNINDY